MDKQMDDQKRFWVVFVLVIFVYGGYLLHLRGYVNAKEEPVAKPPEQAIKQPEPVAKLADGGGASLPDDINAFVSQNVNLVNISTEISMKQTEFSRLQNRLNEMGFGGLNWTQNKEEVDEALKILRGNKQRIEELIELTKKEESQINEISRLGKNLKGDERDSAEGIASNLWKQNYFKREYFIEVGALLNVSEQNIIKIGEGKVGELTEINYSQANNYLVNQVYFMDEAKKEADRFNSIMRKLNTRPEGQNIT
jgi:hypothetical protein